jgi:molybdate transport system substrate-binding protein
MKCWMLGLWLLLLGSGLSQAADPPPIPLRIAAAADLVFCLDALNEAFRQAHPGTPVHVSPGSSGNLLAQIQQGAPFDLFLSADRSYPLALIAAGSAESNSLTHYANGRLVLWTLKPEIVVTNGLSVLTHPAFRRLVLANPDHAPYGRAARDALQRAGLWNQVTNRLVLADNIAQAAQWVQTGAADAGLVALSLVSAPRLKNLGTYWVLPEDSHVPLEQAAVLTRRGATNSAARAYLNFLRTPEARAIFDQYGFRLPTSTLAP